MFSNIKNFQKGATALISILIIMAAALVISLSVGMVSMSELKINYGESRSAESLAVVETCVDESLLRLAWNSSYSGGTLSYSEKSCEVAVEGSGTSRTIYATSTIDNFTKKAIVGVDLSGGDITISSWREN